MEKIVISDIDNKYLRIIRNNISDFLSAAASRYGGPGLLLDIAPQIHEGATPYFKSAVIKTLDIDPNAGATFTADICHKNNDIIPDNYFDYVVCTEVLEHTLNPFDAIAEIYRILKPDGYLFASTPFNFRIHGPLPDCWRFTEHGWRELLRQFNIISLEQIETEDRALMPVHYTAIAQKPKNSQTEMKKNTTCRKRRA